MCDELSRAGDLFVLLFRNPQDGMSYIRFVTKDRIAKIETAPNDWETELIFYETQDTGDPKPLVPPPPPRSPARQDAVMLHYTINKPMGAMLGESDLTTSCPGYCAIPACWRTGLDCNWAMRAFLWLITVPSSRVKEKQEQYRTPPEPGSIIVKDESEIWEANSPNLNAQDARYDMQAVRAMIDAGSRLPAPLARRRRRYLAWPPLRP